MNWKETLFIPIGAAIFVVLMPYFILEALLDGDKLKKTTSYTYVGNV